MEALNKKLFRLNSKEKIPKKHWHFCSRFTQWILFKRERQHGIIK